MVRHIIIVGLAAVLLLAPGTRAPAAGTALSQAAPATDYSAAKKKKASARKAKKERYLRAVPSK